MNVAVVMIFSLAVLYLGFRFYGGYVARAVGIDPSVATPARTVNDGVDYVPTKPLILFGHHFAAIAAAGPIVGPTLALYFGILPAWLWVVLGVIFIGAVHDFTALFVATREGGKSIGEVAKKTLGKPGFLFYTAFAILLCLLVIAAFLQLTAVALTSAVPPDDVNLVQGEATSLHVTLGEGGPKVQLGGVASASVIVMTAVAPLIGWMVYRKHLNVLLVSVFAAAVAFLSVVAGFYLPITLAPKTWMIVITAYVFFASWIPVWIILQPRDFVNAQILFLGLLSMVVGIVAFGMKGGVIHAPLTNLGKARLLPNLGLLWPFLFVTIACGAASGAHGLVCGGTTCKQISNEKHARIIGYGGMLLEGLLALCVLLVVTGGLDFAKYESLVYPAAGGKSNAPLAFALGLGRVLQEGLGFPAVYGTIWGIILLEGFLITTIDALVRLARYLFEELWLTLMANPPAVLKSRIFNSLLVIALMSLFSFRNAYLKIWPIFGSANQLLAALTLIAVTAWLYKHGRRYWFTAIPAIFMAATTITSLAVLLGRYWKTRNWTLLVTDVILLAMAAGVIVMTVKYFAAARRNRGSAEPAR